jgi:hypothetical protein
MEGSFLTFGGSEVDRHFPIEYTCTSPHTLKISEAKKRQIKVIMSMPNRQVYANNNIKMVQFSKSKGKKTLLDPP